jgi:pSer/pThr/pTyr-binding forkhead associated (FHA) protein
MLVRLKIIEGPRQDEEFVVKDEIILGRNKGDLSLRDGKASSQHARIYQNNEGLIEIEDLKSSNGTFVNGERITKKILKSGDKIQIGKTFIRVEEDLPPPETGLEKGSWQETVDQNLERVFKKFEKLPAQKKDLKPFSPPISLEITQGIQSGTLFVFGFGPRQVGKLCRDAVLFDPAAPDLAFELLPGAGGSCTIKVAGPQIRINGKDSAQSLAPLKTGDLISFGQTVIHVKLLEKA